MSEDQANRSRIGRWLLAALLAATSTTAAFAQKKPSGPPAPPGTIFYTYNGQMYAMQGGGTEKTVVFSTLGPMAKPSSLVYGTDAARDRIWLGFESTPAVNPQGLTYNATELYAYKLVGGVVRSCRITNLNTGYLRVERVPSWSNGGDNFVSFVVQDVSGPPYPIIGLVRANKTGEDINAAIVAGVNLDLDASAFGAALTQVLPQPAVQGYATLNHHTWSPDGNLVAYTLPATEPIADSIYVTNVTSGVTGEIWRNGSINHTGGITWSPNGQRIAIQKYRHIHTVAPDGSSAATPYLGDSRYGNGSPQWSPDSTQLAFPEQYRGGGGFTPTYEYNVVRGLATGGTKVKLTGDLDPRLGKDVIAWVP